jgi:hypothetical protein
MLIGKLLVGQRDLRLPHSVPDFGFGAGELHTTFGEGS